MKGMLDFFSTAGGGAIGGAAIQSIGGLAGGLIGMMDKKDPRGDLNPGYAQTQSSLPNSAKGLLTKDQRAILAQNFMQAQQPSQFAALIDKYNRTGSMSNRGSTVDRIRNLQSSILNRAGLA